VLAIVPGKESGLLEGIAIGEQGDALPRRQLAGLVLLLNALGAAPQFQVFRLSSSFSMVDN
jgi:hypothetical protein